MNIITDASCLREFKILILYILFYYCISFLIIVYIILFIIIYSSLMDINITHFLQIHYTVYNFYFLFILKY